MSRRHFVRYRGVYVPDRRILRAYCGGFSSGGGGGGGGGGTISPSFFVSPTGSDSNNGTSNTSPFLTLGKAQSAMRGQPSNGIKATTVMAGTYVLGATINLTSSDNGTTWQYDSNSGVNTAIIDGNSKSIDRAFDGEGSNNITFNGLKIQNFNHFGIVFALSTACSGIVVKNCEFSNTTSASGISGAANSGAVVVNNNSSNITISNNYINTQQTCAIGLIAFGAGQTLMNATVTGNVCIGCATSLSDNGVIYTNNFNNPTGFTNVVISNNFIRDHGSSSLTNDVVGIYLDDRSSNVKVTGNIVGPPAVGAINTGNRNNTSAFLLNDDSSSNSAFATNTGFNTITGNIIDTGGTAANLGGNAMVLTGILTGTSNTFANNIIVCNFSGNRQTSSSGNAGYSFIGDSNLGSVCTINNNLYFNYGGGQASPSSFRIASDSNPTVGDPLFVSGSYIYLLQGGSPAFSSPINFPGITGGWGPIGFIIPSSVNHSNP